MQAASTENPFVGKLCLISFKSAIIYQGKIKSFHEEGIRIEKWLREGLILDDGTFVHWSNISSISPKED